MVMLITGAGGSFGNIINATGIGDYIVETMQNFNVPLILLAFILSQVLRAAQGSATVALVTTSAIVAPSISAMGASPVLWVLPSASALSACLCPMTPASGWSTASPASPSPRP